MTALDRVNVAGFGINKDIVRQMMNQAVWAWFNDHKDDVIFTKKVFFFSVTLRVRDIRLVIERIAGPEVVPS